VSDRLSAAMRSSMIDYSRRWRESFGRDAEYAIAVEALRVSRVVTRGIEKVLRRHDLTMAQWTILTIVSFTDDQRMPLGKLAEIIDVHPSTVSSAVDKLEHGGWMTRELPDRRTVLAALSPSGIARLGPVEQELIAANFGLAPIDDPKDVDAIHRCFGLLRPAD
jgi:DNA-binding MarR family transcriptional regulator